ncbi:MFS general substrate transporter [Gonapodya prolifera JEL478]|uniref:MFS general substrate transporter n=1 Tax=Gonapodya prolifera (strain JEL478) TaxID=1344416 RepID=A0A139AL70_GONPJ|nr:MFS general substrate transporter [Gonapodya prolifera JEL478]|eukprot:KXS17274.1 MFS general substrate transporter [Gonapodya prolifera JEL478]
MSNFDSTTSKSTGLTQPTGSAVLGIMTSSSHDAEEAGSAERIVVRRNTLPTAEQEASTTQIKELGDSQGSLDERKEEEPQPVVEAIFPGDDNAFQAWVMVAAAFMVQFFSIGQRDMFGVLQRYFVAEQTFPGSSNLQISLIGALSASVLMAFGPTAGFMVGRFGLRTTILLGGVFMCAGEILGSFATELWHAHLSLGVIVGVGFAFSYFPAVSMPSQWFKKRRGLAQGLCVMGSGLGGFALSNWTQRIIDTPGLGWKWALRIDGLAALAVVGMSALFIGNPPRNPALELAAPPKKTNFWLDVRGLFSNRRFLTLYIQGFMVAMSFYIPYYFTTSLAANIGLTPTEGAFASSFVNIGSMVGRFGWAYATDFLGPVNTFIISTVFQCISMNPIIPSANSYGYLIFGSFLYGTSTGGWTSVIPLVCASIVGAEHLPFKLGWLLNSWFPGTLVGTPIGGLIADAFTTYSPDPATGVPVRSVNFWPLFIYSVIFQVVGLVMVLWVRWGMIGRKGTSWKM